MPDLDIWFEVLDPGPLSPAHSRNLFLRLPGLAGESVETLEMVLRTVRGARGCSSTSMPSCAAALERFERVMGCLEARVEEDPGRADLQTDLVVSLFKKAQVKLEAAARHPEGALELLRTLQSEGRLSPEKAEWTAVLEGALGGGGDGKT